MLEEQLQALRNVTEIQLTDGNWNYDYYMHGMANGLILALAIMENKEVKFLSAPKKWLRERKVHI
jgi:hypothetical protein